MKKIETLEYKNYYNDYGKLVLRNLVDKDKEEFIVAYKYYPNGKEKEIRTKASIVYKDKDEKVIKCEHLIYNTTVKYFYNKDNVLEKEVSYDKDMNVISSVYYQYDSNRNPISKKVYDSDNNTSWEESNVYDINNRKTIAYLKSYGDNVIIGKKYFIYDDNNRVIEAIETSTIDGEEQEQLKSTFKYDDEDNIIFESIDNGESVFEYIYNNNIVTSLNKLTGQSTIAIYDDNHELKCVIDNNTTETYFYDKLGNLIKTITVYDCEEE